MHTLIGQLLMEKGNAVVSIAPTATVYDAVKLMGDKNIGSLIVLNSRGKLAGIFAERDALRRVLLTGKSAQTELVQSAMTKKVVVASPDMTVSPFISATTRSTPWVDGCCGPRFKMKWSVDIFEGSSAMRLTLRGTTMPDGGSGESQPAFS